MNFTDNSLDDLLRKVLTRLLKVRSVVSPTKGPNRELLACNLTLNNPRNRLSRSNSKNTLASCLGEFIWYMSKSDRLKDIQYYIPIYDKFSDDGLIVYGAYGPRIFYRNGYDQLSFVIEKLTRKPNTRKAIIQIFDPVDSLQDHKDIPCTCSLQFFIRGHSLHLITHMRSNDAYKGLPHDIFCFTMIQEIVANALGKKLGKYHHLVGSLHLYEDDIESAQSYLNEGWQSIKEMPSMPAGNQLTAISAFTDYANKIRNGNYENHKESELDDYWSDLVQILKIIDIFKQGLSKMQTLREALEVKEYISTSYYDSYLGRRVRNISHKEENEGGLF
ncbi:thymidylate synthase [Oceanicaulis sp.]|uniref:thymidylate synthase n=1 Tax=Oceanicaulis sp. TaxID=1924941 RepID=UPI003BAC41E5